MQVSRLIYTISAKFPNRTPPSSQTQVLVILYLWAGLYKYTRFRKKMITNGKKRALARFCRSCKITCR